MIACSLGRAGTRSLHSYDTQQSYASTAVREDVYAVVSHCAKATQPPPFGSRLRGPVPVCDICIMNTYCSGDTKCILTHGTSDSSNGARIHAAHPCP